MTQQEFQQIPLERRLLNYEQTKNQDILYFTLSRISGTNYNYLRQEIRLEPYLVHDYMYIIGKPSIIVDINDGFNTCGIPIYETTSINPSEALIRCGMRDFFNKSY